MKKQFPLLPTVEELKSTDSHFSFDLLRNTFLVGSQHLLETTGSLIEAFVELGLPPSHIFICGKSYSTNLSVVRQLKQLGIFVTEPSLQTRPGTFSECYTDDIQKTWNQVLQRITPNIHNIVILDDGGRVISTLPQSLKQTIKIAAIEQTTFGAREVRRLDLEFPVILVAESAAKRTFESPMIADAVTRKLESFHLLDRQRACGVIGTGAIAQAVFQRLKALNHDVKIFDPLSNSDPQNFMENVEVVFGCTGHDVSQIPLKAVLASEKTLISCSSEDKEFLNLISQGEKLKPWKSIQDTIHTMHPQATFSVLNGGFPINFDRSPTSVPTMDIQLTRGLLFGAFLQSLDLMRSAELLKEHALMLDPVTQRNVVHAWIRSNPFFSERTKDLLLPSEWYRLNSGGTHVSLTVRKNALQRTSNSGGI